MRPSPTGAKSVPMRISPSGVKRRFLLGASFVSAAAGDLVLGYRGLSSVESIHSFFGGGMVDVASRLPSGLKATPKPRLVVSVLCSTVGVATISPACVSETMIASEFWPAIASNAPSVLGPARETG